MADLASMGITVQRNFHTESTQLNGITTSSNDYTELAFSLAAPAYPELKLTLTREGFGKKLVKIFKKELQTGDADFDALVYISSDSPDDAKAFLASQAVRHNLGRLISSGGHLEVDGGFVKLVQAGKNDTEDSDTIELVTALQTRA